ncbi:hypothetical protein PG994_014687 [Apiospora phragmitis]|uniref:Uncharacterized protein n=1 Tax=Apiospora phragmitis TaxID=2905665 RepID=A0ABR1SUB2_9PEZI
MASRRSAAGKERQRSAVDNDSSSRLPSASAFAVAADISSRPLQTPYSNVRSSVLASPPVPATATTSASPRQNLYKLPSSPTHYFHIICTLAASLTPPPLPRYLCDFVERTAQIDQDTQHWNPPSPFLPATDKNQ